jgi:regulator of protease activity HflC (stomatin/prohibitin superfamily)
MIEQSEALVQQEAGRAEEVLSLAKQSVVETDEQYLGAAEFLKTIKGYIGRAEELRTSLTKPINESLKRINDLFRPVRSTLESAETILKQKVITFQQAMERKRLAQEARLREIASKEQEKLEAQAAKLEEKGKAIQAEAKREAAASIPTPAVIDTTPKAKGISFRDVWDFEIVSPEDVPDEYRVIDTDKIKRVVQATKGELEIKGVRIFKRQVVAAGRT